MITGKERSKIRTVSWEFEQDLEDGPDLVETWGCGTLDDRTCEQRHGSGNVPYAHGISELGWSCRFDKRNRLAGKSVQIFF